VAHLVDVVDLIFDKASAEPPQFMVPEFRGHEAFCRGLNDHEVVAAENFHELDVELLAGVRFLKVGNGLYGVICEAWFIPNPNVYYVYAKTTFDSAASLR
jgi:hypothetical protein